MPALPRGTDYYAQWANDKSFRGCSYLSPQPHGIGKKLLENVPRLSSNPESVDNLIMLCPNCHHKMRRLDEQTDNQYLTPAQDAEERLNSVDYDVWLCDNCGEVDILPYVNRSVNYKVCQRCGARAAVLASERIVQKPTYRSDGIAIKDYVCRNCGHHNPEQHKIPKLPPEAPIIIGGIGGAGRGFGGGGGFSGGSFGGGMTGGGGASGGW